MKVLENARLDVVQFLTELVPHMLLNPWTCLAPDKRCSGGDSLVTEVLAVCFSTMRDGCIDESSGADLGGATYDFHHGFENGSLQLTAQLAVTPARVDKINGASELLDGVILRDLAACKHFEQLTESIPPTHVRLLFVVECVEYVLLLVLGELHRVSVIVHRAESIVRTAAMPWSSEETVAGVSNT